MVCIAARYFGQPLLRGSALAPMLRASRNLMRRQ